MKKTFGVVLAASLLMACGVSNDSASSRPNLPKRVDRLDGSADATVAFPVSGGLVLDVTIWADAKADTLGQANIPVCYGPLAANVAVGEITCADDKTIKPVVIKAGQVTQTCNGERVFSVEPTSKITMPTCGQPMARVYNFDPQITLQSK